MRAAFASLSLAAACATTHPVLLHAEELRAVASADGCFDIPKANWTVDLRPLASGRASALACGHDSVYEWLGAEWQLVSMDGQRPLGLRARGTQ
jgi:hypothetical protein